MSSTDSNRCQKLDGFPLESLDPFRWNHWMTSIGISGCFRLEQVDGLPRNTHGGASYTVRAGPGAKPYIDIGVSWKIHSDREASLQMCWGGRPLTSLENAEAFYKEFGEMLRVAKAKRFQLGTRELV